jgi:hypothetical protein
MKRLLLLALLLAPPPAAAQRASLAAHLEQALDLDAAFRTLAAQRDAVAARRALARSLTPGSPVVGGDTRIDTRGPRESRELIIDLAAPVWLPGQRGAYGNTVQAGVAEFEARLLLRRLEVAGLLREAWWSAGLAGQEARVGRDRLATSRDIARDVQRRAELGDIPPTDALLAQNETLAAESRSPSRGGARRRPRGLPHDHRRRRPGPDARTRRAARPRVHPALLAAEAGVEAAEAQARLIAATPRDNPELGVFGRHEEGVRSEPGVSLGLRLRVPLATKRAQHPRAASAQGGPDARRRRAGAAAAPAGRRDRGLAGGAARGGGGGAHRPPALGAGEPAARPRAARLQPGRDRAVRPVPAPAAPVGGGGRAGAGGGDRGARALAPEPSARRVPGAEELVSAR